MCELCVSSGIALRHGSGSERRRWGGGNGKPHGRVGLALLSHRALQANGH